MNFHDGRVFHFGPVALEFGPAVQKDCSDAPNSKFLIGFSLVNSLACHIFRNQAEHGGNFNSFVISGILAKQADEFCDEFGRCVPQKTCFFRDIAKSTRLVLRLVLR